MAVSSGNVLYWLGWLVGPVRLNDTRLFFGFVN
jgi:hypothetical protein